MEGYWLVTSQDAHTEGGNEDQTVMVYCSMIHLHVATMLSSFRDYQEIKIQEQVQKLDIGQISSRYGVCK